MWPVHGQPDILQNPRYFSLEQLFTWLAWSTSWCIGLVLPTSICWTSRHAFMSVTFSSLWMSLWMAGVQYLVYYPSTPPNLALPADLLGVHPTFSSRLWVDIFNRAGFYLSTKVCITSHCLQQDSLSVIPTLHARSFISFSSFIHPVHQQFLYDDPVGDSFTNLSKVRADSNRQKVTARDCYFYPGIYQVDQAQLLLGDCFWIPICS